MPRSPSQVFAYLVIFYALGGVALAWATGSVLPLLVVALALWAILKFLNSLERRR